MVKRLLLGLAGLVVAGTAAWGIGVSVGDPERSPPHEEAAAARPPPTGAELPTTLVPLHTTTTHIQPPPPATASAVRVAMDEWIYEVQGWVYVQAVQAAQAQAAAEAAQAAAQAAAEAAQAQAQERAQEAAQAAQRAAQATTTTTSPPVQQQSSGGGSGDPWWRVAICEESGRNDPTFGYFGILPSTWHAMGMSGTAGMYSYGTQESVAYRITGGSVPDANGCASW